jgi:hypothetical protein
MAQGLGVEGVTLRPSPGGHTGALPMVGEKGTKVVYTSAGG